MNIQIANVFHLDSADPPSNLLNFSGLFIEKNTQLQMNFRKIPIIVLSFSKYLVTKKQHGDKSVFGKNPNYSGSEEGGD